MCRHNWKLTSLLYLLVLHYLGKSFIFFFHLFRRNAATIYIIFVIWFRKFRIAKLNKRLMFTCVVSLFQHKTTSHLLKMYINDNDVYNILAGKLFYPTEKILILSYLYFIRLKLIVFLFEISKTK